MNRDAWLIFAGLAAALALGLVGHRAWKQHEALRAAEVRLQEMAATSEAARRQADEAQRLLAATRQEAEALAERMATATKAQQQLETEMRSALQSRDVAISELQGRLTVNIVDRILFDSGEASLKPEGMKVLEQVAGVLAGYTNRQIQVFGHTDNIPIRLRFASNWELSTARALAAVRYLSEKAGVDARRLSAVGCGEHQPVADNATPEGRARNRRIALVVLPEQFIPSDVSATNAPAGTSTNAAPSPIPAPAPAPAPGESAKQPEPVTQGGPIPVEPRTDLP